VTVNQNTDFLPNESIRFVVRIDSNRESECSLLIAPLLTIFDFLHNLFTKANVLPNVIKVTERIQLSALLITFKTRPNWQLRNLQFVVVLHRAYFAYSGYGTRTGLPIPNVLPVISE